MYASIAVALAAIVLSAVFGLQASSFPLQAGRLPALLVWLVAGLAIMMLLDEALKWRRRRRVDATADRAAAPSDQHPVEWLALLPFLCAALAYVALVPYAGYLVATPIFIGGVLLVARTFKPLTALISAGGITAFLWVVFIWALHLPIPMLPELT